MMIFYKVEKNMLKRPLLQIHFLLIIFLIASGLSDITHAQKPKKAVPVAVAKVTRVFANTQIELSGTVLPWASSRIAAESDGRVEKLFFREGQFVKKGEILVKLLASPLKLQRDLAVAEKDIVAKQLKELKAGSRIETINAGKAALEQAKARVKLTQNELNRQKKLYSDGVLSLNEYDSAMAIADEAMAQFKEKQAVLDELLAGPRIEKIEQEEANLNAAERRIRIIEDQINRTSIYAPFSGYVVKKETEIGEWLEKGDSALTIISVNPMKVEVNLPQLYFSMIQPGTKAKIFLESREVNAPNESFRGEVIEKIYFGDPVSRTFPVRVKINNPQAKVAPGMFVRVELYPETEKKNSLYVPKDALVRKPKETIVWVIRPNKNKVLIANKVLVEPGGNIGSLVSISSIKGKIKEGDRVVIKGNERLRPNTQVEIINEK